MVDLYYNVTDVFGFIVSSVIIVKIV